MLFFFSDCHEPEKERMASLVEDTAHSHLHTEHGFNLKQNESQDPCWISVRLGLFESTLTSCWETKVNPAEILPVSLIFLFIYTQQILQLVSKSETKEDSDTTMEDTPLSHCHLPLNPTPSAAWPVAKPTSTPSTYIPHHLHCLSPHMILTKIPPLMIRKIFFSLKC